MDKIAFQGLLSEVNAMEATSGVDMNELLNISDTLRNLLVWMIRRNGFQIEDLADYLECDEEMAQKLLSNLTRKTLVEEDNNTQVFVVHVANTRSGRKYRVSDDVWEIFD